MSSGLDPLIQSGHDIISTKYYAVATCTILFYDYLLTLADEIKYAWSGEKSWTFWLFVVNRYFPMTFQLWLLATSYTPHFPAKVCDRTAWYSIFVFVICNFLAQVVLTLRVRAMTEKNVSVTTVFLVITVSQLVLGVLLLIHAAKNGAQPLQPIPLDAYRLCLFVRHRALEVAYTGVSLFYDFLAFSLTIFLSIRSTTSGLKVSMVFTTITEEATRCFLVIFVSHFVIETTLGLGGGSIQLLPAL